MRSVVCGYARVVFAATLALSAAPLSAQDVDPPTEEGGKTGGAALGLQAEEPAQEKAGQEKAGQADVEQEEDPQDASEKPTPLPVAPAPVAPAPVAPAPEPPEQMAPKVEDLSQRIREPPDGAPHPTATRSDETAGDRVPGQAQASMTAAERTKAIELTTVAVLPLRAADAHAEVAKRARALLRAELGAAAGWRPLDEEALQPALAALSTTDQGVPSCDPQASCVTAIANATGARYVVIGQVRAEGAATLVELSAFSQEGAAVASATARLPAVAATNTDVSSTAPPTASSSTAPSSTAPSSTTPSSTAPSSAAPSSAAPSSAAPSSSTKGELTEAIHRLVQAIFAAESLRKRALEGPAVATREEPPRAVDGGEATAAAGERRSIVPLVVVAGTGGTVFAGSLAMYGGLVLTVVGSLPLALGTIANAQVAMLEQEALSSSDGVASADNLSAAASLQASIAANGQAFGGWGQYLLYAGLVASAVGTVAAAAGTTWALTSGLMADETPGDDATMAGLPSGRAPAGDAPVAEPVTSPPAVPEPVPDEPASARPAITAPSTPAPATDAPASGASATHDPAADAPTTGASTTGAPASDEAVVDDPTVETPTKEEAPADDGGAGDTPNDATAGERSSREGAPQ